MLCSTHSGVVKAFIGWVMNAHGVKKWSYMILNELRICNFYQTVSHDQYQTFAETVAEGFPKDKLKPWPTLAHSLTVLVTAGVGALCELGTISMSSCFIWSSN
jgi:hypothetical protein